METIQILTFVILWIISGLLTAFLMIFSDIKLKELEIKDQGGPWILNKSIVSFCFLIIIGPISLFLGFCVLILMVDDLKNMKK